MAAMKAWSTVPVEGGARGRRAIGAASLAAVLLAACTRESPEEAQALLNRGVSFLEQYRYDEAFPVFDRLSRRYPGWEAAIVNRALAALNMLGEHLAVAEASFRRALEINPDCAHAFTGLGMLYRHTQRDEEALAAFRRVREIDPGNPHAAFYEGTILADLGKLEEARRALEDAVRLQPSFASAHWRLRALYVQTGDRERMDAVLEEFKRLDAKKAGVLVGLKYGEAGKYSLAIRDSTPPGTGGEATSGGAARPGGPAAGWQPPDVPRFGDPLVVSSRAALVSDVFPPALALGDLDGDGRLEIAIPAERDDGGARVGVYRRTGKGQEFHQHLALDAGDARVAAFGDVDGDRLTDLVVAGSGPVRLFAGDGRGGLTGKELACGAVDWSGTASRLFVADADSEWDLDIICLRDAGGESGAATTRIQLLNNNRDGTFSEIAAQAGLAPADFAVADALVLDLDGDVDEDLALIGADGRVLVYANERAWRFRAREQPAARLAPAPRTALPADFDGDGDFDLVLFGGAASAYLRNDGELTFVRDEAVSARLAALAPGAGAVGDFQCALRHGLVLDGPLGVAFLAGADAADAHPVDSLAAGAASERRSLLLALLDAESAPFLIVRGREDTRAYPLEVAGPWLALDLRGPESPIPDKERASVEGTGATIEVRAGPRRLLVPIPVGAGGTTRPSTRAFVGLGGRDTADYVRVLWPDAVLQSERDLTGRKLHVIREVERKPSSCPMLFFWDGEQFAFWGDFLGVGGLGYLEAPGAFGKPDPTEYLLLPELPVRAAGEREEIALEVIEPLEECTYLDRLALAVVDHPPDVTVIPDEIFAINAPVPAFRLLSVRSRCDVQRALNQLGRDVTEALARADGRYGSEFELDRRFPGRARSVHALELDFGPEAAALCAPDASPYLFLHGMIEYGYSTSNFASFQAQADFRAPSVLVERKGRWVMLREEWGFPAGYPRYMSVDLRGLLQPGDRRLRVETNMDIHWDEAFLAEARADASLRVRELAPDRAHLLFRGFPREVQPLGPGLVQYCWEEFRPLASFKVMPGSYTRHGDVVELLARTDDAMVVFGPGDGLSIGFDARRLGAVPAGMRRTCLVQVVGYCKDMDLYTAHGERVEPLPFAAMHGYPHEPGAAPAARALWDDYREGWNTRHVGGTFFDAFDGLSPPARDAMGE